MRDWTAALAAGCLALPLLAATTALSAAEVTVLRGQSAPEPVETEVAETTQPLRAVVGGRRAWFVDEDEETIAACVLEDTPNLGERQIRCFENDLFPEESLRVTD